MTLPTITLPSKPTYMPFAKDIDFYALFEQIEEHFDTCFIFESLGEEGRLSRYSIIGFDPQSTIRGNGSTLSIDDITYHHSNPYLALRQIVPQDSIARSYAGGLVGYIGYDAIPYFEPSLRIKKHSDYDQFTFGVYTDGLVYDKVTNEIFYFYYNMDRRGLIKKLMRKKVNNDSVNVTFIRDTMSQKEHAQKVEEIKEEIRKGNTFQCQLGFKKELTITGNTREIYKRLRVTNPSPFMYYVKQGETKIIGASPELLFRLRNGEMETFPLAGTIRRGKTQVEDQQLARTLLDDPKERAEHYMLVDLHRNDIGRVARYGTVKVRNLMDIKKFSHVQHISSEIAGIIRPEDDMFTALAANFPAGTLSGAPKIESMRIIDRVEPDARGPYGGAIGHFGFNGDCTFAIAIRTLFLKGTKGYIQASGGIVYDSKAENEYDEIQRKLGSMREVLGIT